METKEEEEVEKRWIWLLNSGIEDDATNRLVHAAAERPQLRRLFPFLSLDRLKFSRTTTYPYTLTYPFARHLQDDVYQAYEGNGRPHVQGALSIVLDAVVDRLPDPPEPIVNSLPEADDEEKH